MQKNRSSDQNRHLLLNALIGFLGVLLLLLLVALASRVLHPKIVTERADNNPFMVSNVIQLEVLNGCGVPGIATRFTDTLRRFGFDVVESGNFDHFNVEKSFIISRSGTMENARRVAAALGISDDLILRESSPDFYLDVTLVIGQDFESLNL
ncbi:MAG: LytR family transcriptional regulator [Balneolaceae bacterium]|nr:MAG: LytR family transcriptional regulator [Balneolaceae bacterium]